MCIRDRAGNAGLFSTARDVARVYQMLLNGGEIDGQRYLSKETCQLFTTETSKDVYKRQVMSCIELYFLNFCAG